MKQLSHLTSTLIFFFICSVAAYAQPIDFLKAGSEPLETLSLRANFFTERINSVDDCSTWTFRVKLGNGNARSITDLIALPDETYIATGYDSTNASAFIIKINKDGALLAAKELHYLNKSISLKKVKYFSTGNLYFIGDITDQLTNISLPFVLVTDRFTNLDWYKIITVPGFAGSWKGVALDEWRENTFSLLITNDTLINISKVTLTGTLEWSKSYRAKNKPEGIAILNDYWDTYVAYNEVDSGYRKSVVLDFDYNGNYKFGCKVGGSGTQTEYVMHSMRMVNLRPRITALEKKSGVPAFVRLNYSPTAQSQQKEKFNTGALIATDDLRTSQSEWGDMLAASDGTSQDIFLTMTYADNYNTPIRGKQITYPYPVKLNIIARCNDGGYIIGATSAAAGYDMVFTKVDSIGTLPTCGDSNVQADFLSESLVPVAETVESRPGQIQLSPPPAVSITSSPYTINWNAECQTLYCPPVQEPDTCLRTFFKEYRNNTRSMWMRDIVKTGDTLLLIGRVRPLPYDAATERATITMMDTSGNLLDSRMFYSDPLMDLSGTIKLKDGNLLSHGYVYFRYDSIEQFIIKYTPQLNILWQKKLFSADHYRNLAHVIESQEGDLYCYVADKLATLQEKRHVMKLSSSGDPVWFRSYTAGPNNFLGSGERNAGIAELGNFIYIKYNEEVMDQNLHIIKISKTDGSVAWVKEYAIPNIYTSFNLDAMIPNDNHIYVFGSFYGGNIFLKIAEDGSLVSSRRLIERGTGGTIKKAENLFLLAYGSSNYPITDFGVLEMDTGFHVLRRQFMQLPKDGRIEGIVAFSDSVTYAPASFFYHDPYRATFGFQKYNFNFAFGSCEITDYPLTFTETPVTVVSKTTTVENIALPQTAVTNGSFVAIPTAYSQFYCGNLPLCTGIDLTGPVTICDSTTEYTYHVQRNAGCNGIVNWNIDTVPGRVRIKGMTDSTITIKAYTAGAIKIRAKVFASCDWLYDSLEVDLSVLSPGALNLGPDTTICPGNSVLINAPAGYNSYQWQDGSTSPSFTVTAPGIYYLDVTACNNTFRDSVIVSDHPPIPFNAGPDRIKCNQDTLHLMAPTGFISYSWSPAYNINTTNGQNVIIHPETDTAYFVRGEKTAGCFAYDTIRVTVHHSPPVFLGNDTSFCAGGMVLLDAGNGFNSYQWNNGTTGQQLLVQSAGQYSVIAATAQGCRSFDTLRVLNVFTNPVVTLTDNPFICAGSTVTFDAGNFSSYIWSTGNTSRTIIAATPGEYYVTVTDANDCIGSDTTNILGLYPLPSAFLPADTAICSYGKIELRPVRSYSAYLWNTNIAGNTITVSQPGLYWLQVTDNNECKGTDSIVVNPKECMKGFYIPDAFSPNDDGNNDVFMPLLYGIVKQYRFTVFNRWGEKVFETRELTRGWNGTLNGTKQDTNVFVWTCTYQFEGEVIKFEKGKVVLIR